jgi:PAS domain S-box-containing protein
MKDGRMQFKTTDRSIAALEVKGSMTSDSILDFREIAESSLQGLVVHRGEVLWMNKMLYDLMEIDEEVGLAEGTTVFDFIHPDDLQSIKDNVSNRFDGEEISQNYEFRLHTSSGRLAYVDMRVSLIQWHDGPAILAAIYDITEKREAEQKQKFTEAVNRSIFNLSPDFISVTKIQDGEFIRVNDTFIRLFEFERDEIIGETSENLRLWATADGRQEVLDALEETGFVTNKSVQFRKKSGELFFIDLSAMIIEGGKEPLLCLLGRDVTERLAFEENLRKSRDEAERASFAKSEFLANMSHEIRTPMNGILGMTELLLEGDPDERSLKKLNVIRECGESLLSLLNDILDLSKLEAGQVHLENGVVEVQNLIDGVVNVFQHNAKDKGLAIVVDISSNVPAAIPGDAARLRQVLFNLVGNAMKFTDMGKISIDARKIEKENGAPFLEISVTDTGIGIEPQFCNTLFGRFVQADQSSARRYGGAGLGLAISKQFITLMNGYISVDSEYGKGSRFYFGLPL